VRLDPETQSVVVGPKRALAVSAARLSEPSWLGPVEGRPVMAKVRSLAKPVAARLDGDWLHFDSEEYGVAPGQAAVLYDGDRVLGGAWIDETAGAEVAISA
jgi:tRNA-uridine 2-sulfurtransferase